MLEAFLSHVASEALLSLRSNLENSEGDGRPLAGLQVWDRLKFIDDIDTGEWGRADRTNADRPLVDTGRLLDSIHVSGITAERSGGNLSFRIELSAAEYGNQYTEDRTYDDVALGRTQSLRESRNFAGAELGKDYVIRKTLSVPGRPWNRISGSRLQQIANGAARRARG
jgi:hypothetical protein